MKRGLTLGLACMLLLVTLAGFAEAGQDETVTLTVWGSSPNPQYAWNDTILVQEIENRLGIRLDCECVGNDEAATRFNLMIAEDNLPDIILGMPAQADAVEYGNQGYLLRLNDYIDQYAPHLAAYMEKYPMLKAYMGNENGDLYRIVFLKETLLQRYPKVWINKVWLDNVGMDVPTSVEELYDVLKAFQEQDANGNGDPNDEIPFSYSTTWHNAGLTTMLMGAFGFQVPNSATGTYLLQADDENRVYIAETTEAYKAYLTFLNKMYAEGLMDNESFTQTGEEYCAKVAEDRVGFFGGESPSITAGVGEEFNNNFVYLGSLTSEYNSRNQVVVTPVYTNNTRLSVSAATKNPEAVMKLIDYFYTEEGIEAAINGYEGLTYEIVEEKIGDLNFQKMQVLMPEDWSGTAELWKNTKGVIQNHLRLVEAASLTEKQALACTAEQADTLIPVIGQLALMVRDSVCQGVETTEVFPALVYTDAENEVRSTMVTDMQNYILTMRDQFITGQLPIEENWDNFQKTLQGMGLETLMNIEQAAYDRMR